MSEAQTPPQAPQDAEYTLEHEDIARVADVLRGSLYHTKFDPDGRATPDSFEKQGELNMHARSVMDSVVRLPAEEKGKQAFFSGAALGLAQDMHLKAGVYEFLQSKEVLNREELTFLSEFNRRLDLIQKAAGRDEGSAGYDFTMQIGGFLEEADRRIAQGTATKGVVMAGLGAAATAAPAPYHETGILQELAKRVL